MKFDVILGNPPYQINDGGGGAGKSASPIYNKFIEQAKKLNPENLLVIIPSRWFNGGKGLDQFREDMLNDTRISTIVDYADSKDCFPGVDIPGGVCYFLWDSQHTGPCKTIYIEPGGHETSAIRFLNEFPTFIRNNQAVNIVEKIATQTNSFMSEIVSSRKPFGLESKEKSDNSNEIILRNSSGLGSIKKEKIKCGFELLPKWKTIVSKVTVEHAGVPGKDGMMKVLSIVQVLPPNSACTETYLIAGSFDNELEAKNLEKYLKTKFVRFLISQMLASMNMSKSSYSFVPQQNYGSDSDINWNKHLDEIDSQLYQKYGLSEDEILFINSKIKGME